MFTDAEIQELREMRVIPFDTFKERIVVYKSPSVTYVNTNSNYNFAFGPEQRDVSGSYTVNSGELYARVQYIPSFNNQLERAAGNNAPLIIANPYVKICVSGETDRTFFQDAQKVVVDNIEFKKVSNNRPRGVFGRDFHEFYFERIE